jgi:hypothetical protein
VVHRVCTPNTGDRSANPADYFDLGETEVVDVSRGDLDAVADCDADLVVLGGGGLFYPDWTAKVYRLIKRCRAPVVVWGAGLNYGRACDRHFSGALLWTALRGLRENDAPSWADWVPCVSCMSRTFEAAPKSTVPFVIYDHVLKPVPVDADAPRANNEQFATMQEAVDFLAQGETVLTATYHGAYWATLLGRRVAVWPWVPKMLYFRHQPCIMQRSKRSMQHALRNAVAYPRALEECRAVNEAFYRDVVDLTGGP